MKLGVSLWSYVSLWHKGTDVPSILGEINKLGVDGVELLDYFWRDRQSEISDVEIALKDTGLQVGIYSVSNNFVTPDKIERASQIDMIKAGVDSACNFGAKIVRVFSGNEMEGIQYDDAFAWVVEGLMKAADYAYGNGVTLALENHGTLFAKSEQVESIIKAVASPALKANPDTANFLLVHEASHEAVDRLATRAAMVHFKDFTLVPDDYEGFAYQSIDGTKYTGTAIGEGDIALWDCLLSLRQAGFDGWLNIEYEAGEDPITGVARSVENTKKLLQRSYR